jgi:hypothetical protein
VRKNLLPLLACVVIALSSSTASAQRIDSMMLVYSDTFPTEKIHIHFDKTVYNRTETVWYKVYILQNGDLPSISKNVYVEWYDTEGKLIKQTVAPLYQSAAKGSFDIPAGYKGETLRVRAFTRWMMNDDPAFSYEKELSINTVADKSTARPPRPAIRTKVEVFPESGFAVQGLNGQIAFKATDQYGNPVLINGVVVDNTNKVLDKLIVKHDGMGSFNLMPSPQQTYQVNWSDENGGSGSTPIPVTKTQGARINLKLAGDKVKFLIERTAAVPDNFKQLTLLLHMNKVPIYQYDINASERTQISSEFDIDTLPTGLLQFTLFTSDWIPVAERVIFINQRKHEFDATLSAQAINLDKKGKNIFEIFVPDTTLSNMSLSVTDADLHPADQQTIFSDILLSSEIRGKIYNPGYYFSNDSKTVEEHLDLVMLTNGWRRFDWAKIKALAPPKITYPFETEYMTLRGKVKGNQDNKGAVLTLVVSGKDSSRRILLVPLEDNGTFKKEIFFFDTATVFYAFNGSKKTYVPAEAQLNNSLLKPLPRKLQASSNVPFLWSDSLSKSKLDVLLLQQELLRKKMAETTLQEVTVTGKMKTKDELLNERYASGFFAQNHTAMFDLTDDPRMTAQNVFEYLQGKVAGLYITKMGPNVEITWRNDEPAYFLNEMRVESKKDLINVPMSEIAMVKVFRPLFMFAPGSGRGGAIVVYSKKGGVPMRDDAKTMNSVVLSGYSSFKEFYSPSYDSLPVYGANLTDNRTTLYWNPNLVTDSREQRIKVEFFNNDFTKTFRIVLEGINEAGKMTQVVRMINAKTKVGE